MHKYLKQMLMAFGAAMVFAGAASAQIKIALIEPLSGAFANIGDLELKQFREIAEDTNAAGGLLNGQKLEIVPFDSKGNPQDALSSLQLAIDQGIRFVTQGSSSAVAGALIDAIKEVAGNSPRL
jgi:branched-chain amino acid transport system substrate-binding protein